MLIKPTVSVCLALCILGSLLFAQSKEAPEQNKTGAQTRTERLLQERRDRLAVVQPVKPSRIVGFVATVENSGFDQFITAQARHWRFGFGKISPASGLTPAVQYERPRLGGSRVRLRGAAAVSVRGYQDYDFRLGLFDEPAPLLGEETGFLGAPFDFDRRSSKRPRSFVYADFNYRDFPQEEFFGLGGDSRESDRTDYRYQQGVVDLVAGLHPVRWAGLQLRIGYLSPNLSEGDNDRLGNLEDVFGLGSVPGLETQPSFLHLNSGLFLAWEGDPNLPAAELGFEFSRFNDMDSERYAFNRFSVDARGFLPLGSRQRTLAARFLVSRDYADAGNEVPFYLMKTMGGHNTLRGYRNFRFRDSNLLYFSGEYRWEATTGIELVGFYDAGKVFPGRSGFEFKGLRHSIGGGIRGKSFRRVIFRLEVGRSEEGTFTYVSFGPAF